MNTKTLIAFFSALFLSISAFAHPTVISVRAEEKTGILYFNMSNTEGILGSYWAYPQAPNSPFSLKLYKTIEEGFSRNAKISVSLPAEDSKAIMVGIRHGGQLLYVGEGEQCHIFRLLGDPAAKFMGQIQAAISIDPSIVTDAVPTAIDFTLNGKSCSDSTKQ